MKRCLETNLTGDDDGDMRCHILDTAVCDVRLNHLYPLLLDPGPRALGRLAQCCKALCEELVRDQRGLLYFPQRWRETVVTDLFLGNCAPEREARLYRMQLRLFLIDKSRLHVFAGLPAARCCLSLHIDTCANGHVIFRVQGGNMMCSFLYGPNKAMLLPTKASVDAVKQSALVFYLATSSGKKELH